MGRTHIAIVLDRSGSMNSRRAGALAGVNGYLATVATDRALADASVSVLLFDDLEERIRLDWVRHDVPARACPLLREDEYEPFGTTPLYDAIGEAIRALDLAVDPAEPSAVLVVMTDGAENASREHTLASIRALIEARQRAGWLVIFLGQGLHVAEQGVHAGTRVHATAAFAGGDYSVHAALDASARLTQRYASAGSPEARATAADAGFTEAERQNMAQPRRS